MCGIAGYLGALPPDDAKVRACLSAMGQRGPDAAGVYRHAWSPERQICLLHSRLAIIDLDPRSNQPFCYGPRVLVLNGEIYNYLELKTLLSGEATPLHTNSDTEVLLRLLAEKGPASLDVAEGMWAFALYNEDDGSLLLSRDRFGEKPLYILRTADGLYFASEVKFLVALSGCAMPPNKTQLLRYMINGYRSLYKTGETFFEGVEELRSGHLLLDTPARRQITPYWQPAYRPDDSMSFEQAVIGTRDRLLRAVELRLRADLPMAFCQSGGIDSNGLISIAKNVFGYDVHGFTIMNTHDRYAEQDMVDLAVQEQGLCHTAISLSNRDFLDRLRQLIRYHDAPVYTVSAYTHWLLMEAVAANGYKIAVSGTGADELFSGYYDHHLYYLAAIHDETAVASRALRNWQEHILPLTQNPLLRDPTRFITVPQDRSHLYMSAQDFSKGLATPFHEEFVEDTYCSDPLRNRMLNELFTETIPPPMHDEDLNAMYWSIENRSPYLDRSLFDFSYSIPSRHLIRDGHAKAVLREALRGIVPDPLLDNRRKMGFNAPLFDLLDVKSSRVRQYLLDDNPIFELVRKDFLEAMLKQDDPDHSTNLFLFYTLSARMFLEEFAV